MLNEDCIPHDLAALVGASQRRAGVAAFDLYS